MTIQELLQQMTDMGILGETPMYSSLANISPETISGSLQDYFDLTQEDLPPHLFKSITKGDISGTLGKTYSPQMQLQGQDFTSNLINQLQGQKAQDVYGGFAGSGQQDRFIGDVKDEYGKSMAGVLTGISGQKLQSRQNLQDMINQWRETGLELKGQLT